MWSSRADMAASPAAAPYRRASHRAKRPRRPLDPDVQCAFPSVDRPGALVAVGGRASETFKTPAASQGRLARGTAHGGRSGSAAAAGFRDDRGAGPRRLALVLRGWSGLGADL